MVHGVDCGRQWRLCFGGFRMRGLISFMLKAIGFFTVLAVFLGAVTFYLAASWLVVNDKPVASDAVVLLSGELSRPLYGADLYKKGYAPVIYVSRPKLYDQIPNLEKLGIHLKRDEEYYKEILLKKGVPERAIHFYSDRHVSTVEEAESLKKVLGDHPVRLLVVTSPLHTRRAKAIFEAVMPNAEIFVVATPYEDFAAQWWTDQKSTYYVVLETAKTVFYYLGGAFRSTDPPPQVASVPEK